MQIIVGLGNPGKKYERNRHNVGFETVDCIAKKNNFSPWRKKFQSQISEGKINLNQVILVKPQTLMNNSGFAVKEVLHFYKTHLNNLTVIHDDIDLKVGRMKSKIGGSHGGHNGLRSIDQQVHSGYLRLRIGVDRPINKGQVANFVLSNFSEKDKVTIDNVINIITQDIEMLVDRDINKFTASINQKLKIFSNQTSAIGYKNLTPKRPTITEFFKNIIK